MSSQVTVISPQGVIGAPNVPRTNSATENNANDKENSPMIPKPAERSRTQDSHETVSTISPVNHKMMAFGTKKGMLSARYSHKGRRSDPGSSTMCHELAFISRRKIIGKRNASLSDLGSDFEVSKRVRTERAHETAVAMPRTFADVESTDASSDAEEGTTPALAPLSDVLESPTSVEPRTLNVVLDTARFLLQPVPSVTDHFNSWEYIPKGLSYASFLDADFPLARVPSRTSGNAELDHISEPLEEDREPNPAVADDQDDYPPLWLWNIIRFPEAFPEVYNALGEEVSVASIEAVVKGMYKPWSMSPGRWSVDEQTAATETHAIFGLDRGCDVGSVDSTFLPIDPSTLVDSTATPTASILCSPAATPGVLLEPVLEPVSTPKRTRWTTSRASGSRAIPNAGAARKTVSPSLPTPPTPGPSPSPTPRSKDSRAPTAGCTPSRELPTPSNRSPPVSILALPSASASTHDTVYATAGPPSGPSTSKASRKKGFTRKAKATCQSRPAIAASIPGPSPEAAGMAESFRFTTEQEQDIRELIKSKKGAHAYRLFPGHKWFRLEGNATIRRFAAENPGKVKGKANEAEQLLVCQSGVFWDKKGSVSYHPLCLRGLTSSDILLRHIKEEHFKLARSDTAKE